MSRRMFTRAGALVALAGLLVACTPRHEQTFHLTSMDERATSEESDEAVLVRLADYTDWQLVNPIRFRSSPRVFKFCGPFSPEQMKACVETDVLENPHVGGRKWLEHHYFPPGLHVLRHQERSHDVSLAIGGTGIHVFVNPPAEAPMLTQ